MGRLGTYILIKLYIVAEEIRQLIQFCTQIFPDQSLLPSGHFNSIWYTLLK